MVDQPFFRRAASPIYPRRNESAHQVEPRNFGQGFSPEAQSDVATLNKIMRDIARDGTVPLDEIVRRLDAYNLPPQLTQSTFFAQITARGPQNAVQLVPKNPERMGLYVSNFTPNGDPIVLSFDAPIQVAANTGAGIPIAANSFFEEANGSVSVNSIFVFCNIASLLFPITVLAYEGHLSITGNPRDRGGL